MSVLTDWGRNSRIRVEIVVSCSIQKGSEFAAPNPLLFLAYVLGLISSLLTSIRFAFRLFGLATRRRASARLKHISVRPEFSHLAAQQRSDVAGYRMRGNTIMDHVVHYPARYTKLPGKLSLRFAQTA